MRMRKKAFMMVLIALLAAALACNIVGGGSHLDDETLEQLTLAMASQSIQFQPGDSYDFNVGVVECCYVFNPVAADVAWSVTPSQGASIDPETGVFTIDPTTPSGSVFTVSADVEHGRRIVTIDVYVYTPEANPLAAGIWREEAEFACETGEEITPAERIGELVFHADGTFSVTWMPFEIYHDYWGAYTFDLERGTLDLSVTGGNYVPDDIDGSGFFSIDDQGRLALSDMWLGTGHEPTSTAICGQRFQH
jgi:hypothetical protein